MRSGEPDTVPAGVARVGPGLVVAHPRLWARPGGEARVAVVPFDPGHQVVPRHFSIKKPIPEVP
ncbi:MAG: hypothetical protein J2P58_08420, partial [Acidimicrobiaceae bacterium]|nr:hypothetical protein [Acidimicrobiaceae bacterium]